MKLTRIEIITQKFEAEIKRLGCDCESVGSVDCVVVSPNTYDFDGYEISDDQKAVITPVNLADDHYTTVDLNIEKTLQNLSFLPDKAGLDAFWEAVYDNTD